MLTIDEISEKNLGDGLRGVTAVITNNRLTPTHASIDVNNNIMPPDISSIERATIETGMIVTNRDLNQTTEQKNRPDRIKVVNIPEMSSVTVRWIISGRNNYTLKVDSKKGGIVSKKISKSLLSR